MSGDFYPLLEPLKLSLNEKKMQNLKNKPGKNFPSFTWWD
jgi:hypothetical protein